MHLVMTASMVVLESEGEECRKVPLSRLISLNKPEMPVLLLGTLAAVVSGVIFPMLGVLISSSIKSFYEPPHQLQQDSRFWTLMYVASGVASFIFLPVEYFLFGVAGGKLVERIRSLSFKSIVHQEISWFDKPSNARLVSKNCAIICCVSRIMMKHALHNHVIVFSCLVEPLVQGCLSMPQIYDVL